MSRDDQTETPTRRTGLVGHREVPEILELIEPWQTMWEQDIDDIGHLTCYGAPACIVHFMDYLDGGWDVYVPPVQSLEIQATLEALRARTTVSSHRLGGPDMCMARYLDPGDQVLMPDGVTWVTVEENRALDGQPFIAFKEGGFARYASAEHVTVKKRGRGAPL